MRAELLADDQIEELRRLDYCPRLMVLHLDQVRNFTSEELIISRKILTVKY